MTIMEIATMLSGGVILAQALHKLEENDLVEERGWRALARAMPAVINPLRWTVCKLRSLFRVIGWFMMAVGGAGMMAYPFLWPFPIMEHATTMSGGMAILIIVNWLSCCDDHGKGP